MRGTAGFVVLCREAYAAMKDHVEFFIVPRDYEIKVRERIALRRVIDLCDFIAHWQAGSNPFTNIRPSGEHWAVKLNMADASALMIQSAVSGENGHDRGLRSLILRELHLNAPEHSGVPVSENDLSVFLSAFGEAWSTDRKNYALHVGPSGAITILLGEGITGSLIPAALIYRNERVIPTLSEASQNALDMAFNNHPECDRALRARILEILAIQ